MNPMRCCTVLVSATVLASCTGLRPAPLPQGPPQVQNPAPEPAPEENAASPENPASAENPASSAEPAEAKPPPRDGASAQAPPCVSPENKSKPKEVKSKPKPVPNEAVTKARSAAAGTPPAAGPAHVGAMPVPVMSILGKRVRGPKGEDLGRVVDVLADAGGQVRVAIIDFGGFLGVGDRRIAVDWPLLRFTAGGDNPTVVLNVGRDKLKAAPEYKDSLRPQTLMGPAAATNNKPQ